MVIVYGKCVYFIDSLGNGLTDPFIGFPRKLGGKQFKWLALVCVIFGILNGPWVFQMFPNAPNWSLGLPNVPNWSCNRPVLPHILYVGKTASGVSSPLGYRIYASLNELLHLVNKLMLCQLGACVATADKNCRIQQLKV